MKNFSKYDSIGSDYHYRQIDKTRFRDFNASVDARFGKLVERVRSLVAGRDLKLLDVGCGDGVALYLLRDIPNLRLFGTDSSEKALRTAKEKVPDGEFEMSDTSSLPYKDESFDVVISSDVIEHVEDPEKMLTEIKRVAKKEAYIIVGTPIRREKLPIDPQHEQEFFKEDFSDMMSKFFSNIELHESHNLVPTLLYNAPTKNFINWRYAINLASILGFNPFLSERKNGTQMFAYMYVICKK